MRTDQLDVHDRLAVPGPAEQRQAAHGRRQPAGHRAPRPRRHRVRCRAIYVLGYGHHGTAGARRPRHPEVLRARDQPGRMGGGAHGAAGAGSGRFFFFFFFFSSVLVSVPGEEKHR